MVLRKAPAAKDLKISYMSATASAAAVYYRQGARSAPLIPHFWRRGRQRNVPGLPRLPGSCHNQQQDIALSESWPSQSIHRPVNVAGAASDRSSRYRHLNKAPSPHSWTPGRADYFRVDQPDFDYNIKPARVSDGPAYQCPQQSLPSAASNLRHAVCTLGVSSTRDFEHRPWMSHS